MNFKTKLSGLVLAFTLAIGATNVSEAVTTNELIDLLLSLNIVSTEQAILIGAVLEETTGVTFSSLGCTLQTAPDLKLGSTGTDVTNLQKFLVEGGHMTMPAGVAYGYFGGLTQSSLGKYQVAEGVYPATGYFGRITRASIKCKTGTLDPIKDPASSENTMRNPIELLSPGTDTNTRVLSPIKGPIPTQSFMKVISPNNRESITEGEKHTIEWKSTNMSSSGLVDIYLDDTSINCNGVKDCLNSFHIVSAKDTGSFVWDTSKRLSDGDGTPGVIKVRPGIHTITVCKNDICGSSDLFLIIKDPASTENTMRNPYVPPRPETGTKVPSPYKSMDEE